MSIIQDYIKGLDQCLDELNHRDIEEVADIIFDACKKGKKVFVCGNGGSASTSSHFARDLRIGTAAEGKPRVQSISLADNLALITSVANDKDYASIFEEQLVGILEDGDVVIGISASGNSPNVLNAVDYARKNGAVTVGLVGFGGGRLKQLAHRSILLSSRDYGQVEDIHMCLAHIITYLVRARIASG